MARKVEAKTVIARVIRDQTVSTVRTSKTVSEKVMSALKDEGFRIAR